MEEKNIAGLTGKISEMARDAQASPPPPQEVGRHVVRDANGEQVDLNEKV